MKIANRSCSIKGSASSFEFSTSFRAPSNIALVKYWGKHSVQLPYNPSISLTLNNSFSKTNVCSTRDQSVQNSFLFEGKPESGFEKRVMGFIATMSEYYPILNELRFNIESHNSFPHSTGIASSASGMSALALCLAEHISFYTDHKLSLNDISSMARIGSGSAARSVAAPVMAWGKTSCLANSSDQYAVTVNDIDPTFETYCDAIVIVDAAKKSVSSSVGHSLMNDHPYCENRFKVAHEHMSEIVAAMKEGDLSKFMHIVESEALHLHSMMMTSKTPYLLMKPDSIRVMEMVKDVRLDHNLPVCYTLDAGPNIHVLYPKKYSDQIETHLLSEVESLDLKIIRDNVGSGPVSEQ
jgi:diphosphomevalonate decarboxylase